MRCRAQLSWRLPPRSRRWRWCLPELASGGATPAWRASWASERKRSIGPISQSSLAAVMAAQPGSSSSCGAIAVVCAWSSRSSSPIERVWLRQRPSSSRAIRTCVVCSRRAELAAEPLLTATAFVDEIVAVVDEQLQLAQPRLLEPRRVQHRLSKGGSSDGERLDQVRLAAHPAAPALRSGKPRRHPDETLPMPLQRPLQTTGHMPTVLQRPPAPPTNPLRPGDQLGGIARLQAIELATNLVHGDSRQRVLGHVHPDHDHLRCLLPLGATDERTGLSRGKLPSSYQVTLDGLGKATATQHWQVSPRATFRNRVSRRLPESQPTTGQHPPSMTLSSGMTPDR